MNADMSVRDRMLLGEAISAVGQCCHILGAEVTNRIIAELDATHPLAP